MLLVLGLTELVTLCFNFYISREILQSSGSDCLLALISAINLLPISVGGLSIMMQKKRLSLLVTIIYILIALLFLIYFCRIPFTDMNIMMFCFLAETIIGITRCFFDLSKYTKIHEKASEKLKEIIEKYNCPDVFMARNEDLK